MKFFKCLLSAFLLFSLIACSSDEVPEIPNSYFSVSIIQLTAYNEFLNDYITIIYSADCEIPNHDISQYRFYSKSALTFKVELLKGSITRNAELNHIELWHEVPGSSNNLPRTRMNLYRNGETDSSYIWTSQTAENGAFIKGRPLLLFEEGAIGESSFVHILTVRPGFHFRNLSFSINYTNR